MRFGVYANLTIEDALDVAKSVIDALEGEDVVLESTLAEALGVKGEGIADMDVDILVTVGGDGTILRAMQWNDSVILGVNAGVLGFLTEVDRDEIEEGVRKVLDGRFLT